MKLLGFFLLFLVFIQLEFVFRLDFCVDVYKRAAQYSVRVFGIKVVSGAIEYSEDDEDRGFFLKTKKRHRKINIVVEGRKNAESARHLVELVEVSRVGVRARIGGRDALRSAMLMTSSRVAYYSLIAALKAKQNCVSFERFVPFVGQEVFEMEFFCILNISIADIIFSAIRHRIWKLSKKLDKEI